MLNFLLPSNKIEINIQYIYKCMSIYINNSCCPKKE